MRANQFIRTILALGIAVIAMFAFRSLAFTIYSVGGDNLQPYFQKGDRLMVNRWSYGLRVGDNKLVGYSRIFRQRVRRGDIVAFEHPSDSVYGVLIARCKAIPGDIIHHQIVPGKKSTCAKDDYYWLESLRSSDTIDSRSFGFVPESHIIGRVCFIVYSIDEYKPWWNPFRNKRFFVWP